MYTDYGDDALAAYEAETASMYEEAGDKAAGELSRWAEGFRAEDERMAAMVAAGALSAMAWKAWRRRRLAKGGGFAEAAERAAEAIHAANVEGYRIAERTADGVRSRCVGVSARELSEALGEPVEAAYADGGRFVPRLDERRDFEWTKRRVRLAVKAGMERGAGIPAIAGAVRRLSGMSRSAAVRAARTAVTSAECSARLDVAKAAKGGVLLEWIAARDSRTRKSHAALDGQKVKPGERFANGLRFPADPKGRPEEVYNCRCTLGYVVGGVGTEDAFRASKPTEPKKPRKKQPAEPKDEGRPKPAQKPEKAGAEKREPGKRPTRKPVEKMTRAELEAEAKAAFVESGGGMGLSRQEAERRFAALVGGNSDAELRKYLAKHGAARPSERRAKRPSEANRPARAANPKKAARAAAKPVGKMDRPELEARARELFEKHGDRLGASADEAMRRFDLLLPSQSDARLRKNIASWEAAARKKAGNESGASAGALNDSNDPDGKKRVDHAERYYEAVRRRDAKKEVSAVAENAGVEEEMVEKARAHLFVNEYDLEKGRARFDEDYEIAQSWQRLRSGEGVQQHDITLLFHESYEYDLMAKGMPYREAHEAAERIYNYSKQLKKWKGGL